MNGADGERRKGLWVTDFTVNGTPARPAANDRASSSPSTTTEPGEVSAPASSKSRPEARATPSNATSDGVKRPGCPFGGRGGTGGR